MLIYYIYVQCTAFLQRITEFLRMWMGQMAMGNEEPLNADEYEGP
jgi:hypothetical protein